MVAVLAASPDSEGVPAQRAVARAGAGHAVLVVVAVDAVQVAGVHGAAAVGLASLDCQVALKRKRQPYQKTGNFKPKMPIFMVLTILVYLYGLFCRSTQFFRPRFL